ncbi:MAG TPA: CopD family protein [Stellaceae bacterium]|nr:CopD family protein [Stellaceae bacterium]
MDDVIVPSIAAILHTLSAVIWVGGMFFAYVVLRPAAGPLDAPARLALWHRVFSGFFPWVFAAVILLLISGFTLFLGGYAAGPHVQAMMAIGIVMILIFLHLYFAPWKRFRAAITAGDNAAAAAQLNQIRTLVLVNLILGLVNVAIGGSGRYWG